MAATTISGIDKNQNPCAARADGNVLAVSVSGFRATYRYLATDFTPVATATDVLTITGSSTKVIRVTRVAVSGTAAAASIYSASIVKRTTANTGGTSSAPSPVSSDSTDPTATATLKLYTANATGLGTGASFDGAKVYLPANSSPTSMQQLKEFLYGNDGDKAITLRGVNESLSINFNGGAVPAGTLLYLAFEWTEDDV